MKHPKGFFGGGGDASTVRMVCEFWLHDSSAFDNFDYSLLRTELHDYHIHFGCIKAS